MIHLTRPPKPQELTDEVVRRKTEAFKADHNKPVWKEKYIHDTLMAMSHNKCCYCECDISEESKYMEVEHFHDKNRYPDEVVAWNNLLPSCKKCNGTKGTHDTVAEPIINPSTDIPQEHMILYHSIRFRYKDKLGESTINVLDLNNIERHIRPRFMLNQQICQKIEDLSSDINNYFVGKCQITSSALGKLRNRIIDLLSLAKADQPYSAVVATSILCDREYGSIKYHMQHLGFWPQELYDLENEISQNRYDEDFTA